MKKYIFTVFSPIMFILIQCLIKYIHESPITNNLGITLSAIGLSQILPFISFQNILINKFIEIESNVELDQNSIITTHELKLVIPPKKIEELQSIVTFIFLLNILIFMLTIHFSISIENQLTAIILGSVNCILSWIFILKK